MTLPKSTLTKTDGGAGSVAPSATGILAIIVPTSGTGTVDVAQQFSRQDTALATLGYGVAAETAAYVMAEAGNPVVVVLATAATAAAYGAINHAGVIGTSVPTAGASAPLYDWDVIVTIVNGGTIGVAGITYTYSLDYGITTSGIQALGTSSTMTLNLPTSAGGGTSGVSFSLGAGTLLAGDTWSVSTTHARMNSSDVTTALEALRTTRIPFEAVLVTGEASTSTIAALDSWLTARETSEGRFYLGIQNVRKKLTPAPATESEATYSAAVASLISGATSIRVSVCADAADSVSPITGFTRPRGCGTILAARLMSIAIGVDPAETDLGPVGNATIQDVNRNPKWHDEFLYPGLDDQHLTTLRSFNSKTGVYITNGRLLSNTGSSFVYVQHARTMNAACNIASQVLDNLLSKSVRKKSPDPATGLIYIDERDARGIESMVDEAVSPVLDGQCQAFAFILSRTDDLSNQAGATVNGQLEVESLAYIKGLNSKATFVKSI